MLSLVPRRFVDGGASECDATMGDHTPDAMRAVGRAVLIARGLGADIVTEWHLLLAALDSSEVVEVIKESGVDVDRLRIEAAKVDDTLAAATRRGAASPAPLPFERRAMQTFKALLRRLRAQGTGSDLDLLVVLLRRRSGVRTVIPELGDWRRLRRVAASRTKSGRANLPWWT